MAEQEKSAKEIRTIVKGLKERKERYQGYGEELKQNSAWTRVLPYVA